MNTYMYVNLNIIVVLVSEYLKKKEVFFEKEKLKDKIYDSILFYYIVFV